MAPAGICSWQRRALITALLAASGTAQGTPSTTWNPERPSEVHIGSLVLDDTQYTDVVITVGRLIGLSTTGPHRTYDSYNPANGQLHIATLSVGDQTYHDVIITVMGLVSVGGWSALTPLLPNDPLFSNQWHLHNTGQVGADGSAAQPGADLNAAMAWRLATGTGVRIAVVDDGLDIHHEDLNVVPGKSWDYRLNQYGDPSSSSSSHGTACAGLAAATGDNGKGVTGVAFNARLVGYNLLASSTSVHSADAITKDLADNHIYSNSYGAADGTGLLTPADELWRDAIETGITTGRGGKGAIYTWAAGNGMPLDRSDYDGQANHHGVLAIAALDALGRRASYSELGANLLVSAPGGEYCDTLATTTTDVSGPGGFNDGQTYEDYPYRPDYTRCMNGTSAATPQAAGTVALLLETNPALSWRDVRAILARTARKTDPNHADWVNNGAGHPINHAYGYGAIDALAATHAAASWNLLPAQIVVQQAATLPQQHWAIADNTNEAATSILTLQSSGIRELEFVELSLTADHPDTGELHIELTSPSGTVSTLSTVHECQDFTGISVTCGAGLSQGYTFGIARLMNEPADGTWTLSVRDGKSERTGSINAWSIKVYGH